MALSEIWGADDAQHDGSVSEEQGVKGAECWKEGDEELDGSKE